MFYGRTRYEIEKLQDRVENLEREAIAREKKFDEYRDAQKLLVDGLIEQNKALKEELAILKKSGEETSKKVDEIEVKKTYNAMAKVIDHYLNGDN